MFRSGGSYRVLCILGCFLVFVWMICNLEIQESDKQKELNDINIAVERTNVDIPLRLEPQHERIERVDVSDRVHIFYYPWYSNPKYTPQYGWNHWNHNILPHWSEGIRNGFIHNVNYPAEKDDIGSSFFPSRGLYSSGSEELLDDHMEELQDYLVVVSWWGQSTGDGEGMKTDQLMHQIFLSAQKFGTKIAVHLEPYEGRSERSVKSDIQYLINTYGKYTSFAKLNSKPILYIYDSYLTPANAWKKILSPSGEDTIRGTPYDALVLGLYLKGESKHHIKDSHMDGFYTYFAAVGFTEGATPSYWNDIVKWGNENDLLSSLSVGPGYDDTRIRPWNSANKKERQNGGYYDRMWEAAIQSAPSFISITSYNEWMEGTQIESAKPMHITDSIINHHQPYTYVDYLPQDQDYYIQQTTKWARQFAGQ